METIVGVLAEQHDELAGLLDSCDAAAWARPSRCPGWSVADVVLHLAQTDELALASVEGDFAGALASFASGIEPGSDVDDGAAWAVERERGVADAELHERWRRGTQRLRAALVATDPGRRVPWVAGDLAARTLGTTRLAETWIHTEDVAEGLGTPVAPSDRLWHVARLAWRTLPYAFARAGATLSGPVAFTLEAPSGATWSFTPDEPTATTVAGPAVDLCRLAGQRLDPAETALRSDGVDADAVLALVRTFA